ncbi:hypothetical protein [Burkholderia thailandensis]|uniref:hypothetical protein n=1 Tax=Burkholderia thailandensis TaxID=57975 RepID=UPI000FD6A36A|nr:hypothetical protein [Burkholderia thailandensis]
MTRQQLLPLPTDQVQRLQLKHHSALAALICNDLQSKAAEPEIDANSGQHSLPLTVGPNRDYLQLSQHSAAPTCIPSPRTRISCN